MATKLEIYGDVLKRAVDENIDNLGAVYTDVIITETKLTRETVTNWLKLNGFTKPGGHTSRRWVNESRRNNS